MFLKLYKQEANDESDSSLEKEDLATISDRSNTPLLSLNESKGTEAAKEETVQSKTESEEHPTKEVETPPIVEGATPATGATGGLPDEDNLGEPVAQQSPENIDLNNTPV